jgi:hypothetical protein
MTPKKYPKAFLIIWELFTLFTSLLIKILFGGVGMKKNASIILLACFMLWVIPLTVFAAEQNGDAPNLEKAILTAKKLFTIPKELDQFDSDYEQNDYGKVWSLRWYSNKGKGDLNVRVDALSHEIVGYHYYNPQDDEGSAGLPQITKTQGKQIALDFIKKAVPSKANEVILEEDNLSFNNPTYYNYSFIRKINDYEYPNNSIHVTLYSKTGKIRSFHVTWENTDTSPVQAKISREEAGKIFNEKFGFELKYFKPQVYGKQGKPVKLTYEINNPHQVAIDASTGEIVMEGYNERLYDQVGGGEDVQNSNSAKQKLTPEEQRITEELKGLISKDQALAAAEKVLNLSDNYTINSASLFRDWEYPELRIWSFSWECQGKNRSWWASAEVDAKSGKVVAFDYCDESCDPGGHEAFIIKEKNEAEKVTRNYLQSNYPEIVKNLRPQPEPIARPLNNPEDKNQPSYFFQYERMVNGIPFSQNYVTATVNSYTGKINSLRIRFVEQDFPKADNVIDKAGFTEDYFAKQPLIICYIKDQDKKMRLVYKLAPAESYRYDAENGQMIGWDGNPVRENKRAEITDIKGHWAENDIAMLNELGYLRLENGKFKPNTEMNQANIMRMLVKMNYFYISDSTEGNWYDPYYQQAQKSGIIKKNEINPSAEVTREEMAKYLARTIMPDKIATMDIYKKQNFKDFDKISKGYHGYVTILNNLGVMKGNSGYWNPQGKIKKGEACSALIRFMKLGIGSTEKL